MNVPPNSVMGRYLTRALRKLFVYRPARKEVRKKAYFGKEWSTGEEVYTCAACGELFRRKNTHVDHRLPVVDPLMGFINWDIYIDRLFCSVDNLVVLCKECHGKKTKEENKTRREVKQGHSGLNRKGNGRLSKRAHNKPKANRKK